MKYYHYVRNLELFLHIGSPQNFIVQDMGLSTACFITTSNRNFCNQYLPVRWLRELFPKTWRIRRLDAVVGKPTLISWIREGTIWFDIVIFSCLYSNNDWYVCTSHLHWPRTMLSGHVTRSFAYQWSPLYIRHKNRQVLLWLPYRMECDKKTRDKFWKKLQSNAWRKIYGL